MTRQRRQRDAGFTLPEVLIAAILSAGLASVVLRTMERMQGLQSANDFESRLHAQSFRALDAIVQDLNRALYQPAAGVELPYVFDDGVADAPYAAHSHTPAVSEAEIGDADFGPNREIVFVLPTDADGNGRPDLNLGNVVWSTDQVSYTVITDGVGNALVRSVNNANPRLIARNVERLVFDTPESSGFTIPLASVRVRLFFRARDRNGALYRHQIETIVRLQRGNL